MLFDINPVTGKYQTGDKPEAECKYSDHFFTVFRLSVFFYTLLTNYREKNKRKQCSVKLLYLSNVIQANVTNLLKSF